jgi:hypothetical protein
MLQDEDRSLPGDAGNLALDVDVGDDVADH